MKRRLVIISTIVVIILFIVSIGLLRLPVASEQQPVLVIRLDDIQDYAFREAQLFLLNESIVNDIPLSLAVITGIFGDDGEVVDKVRRAVGSGSEVAVHGWKHEDFSKLTYHQQVELLRMSRNRINELFDIEVRVFVPPMFHFNEETIMAMADESYDIISTLTDFDQPGYILNVKSLPATVELSLLSNGIWTMKKFASIKTEISKSVGKYGYAILVTHPQEFIEDGKLNEMNVKQFQDMVRKLGNRYSLKTLNELGCLDMKSAQ